MDKSVTAGRRAFTLIELQIASTLMVVIMLVTGMMFYVGLSCMRYMFDLHETYASAMTTMKAVRLQGMQASRYGWEQMPTWNPDGRFGANSIYGTNSADPNGNVAWQALPTIENGSDTSDTLYLRQPSGNNQWYSDDRYAVIFRNAANEVRINTSAGAATLTTNPADGTLLAENIAFLEFTRISFNCFSVSVHGQGTVPDPFGGLFANIWLHSIITLRCAPAEAPEDWPLNSERW